MNLPEDDGIGYWNHVEEITSALVGYFGRPRLGNKSNPFNELLYIILSTRTPPDRYQEVYRALRRAYPKAEELREAEAKEVAGVISRGGLQNRKARAIVLIAQRLGEEFGRVTLSPLGNMPNDEAEHFLTALPEVSLKTARCVLMYALDRSVFPVDTHCFRIAKRLGWLSGGRYPTGKQSNDFQSGIPPGLRKDLHMGMVVLGRRICLPTDPLCNDCPVVGYCPTGQRSIS